MSSIGMAGQGANTKWPNGNISIGDQGPSTLTFTNQVDGPVILIVWDSPVGYYAASFVGFRKPHVSYSLPKRGNRVTLSIANGISGAFSALINRRTRLEFGQVDNTWGEFTAGVEHATVNISRLRNMLGTWMSAKTAGGCVTDMNKCVFVCKPGNNTCGETQTFVLQNCQAGSQPFTNYGKDKLGDDTGGCEGWGTRGNVEVTLGK